MMAAFSSLKKTTGKDRLLLYLLSLLFGFQNVPDFS